MEVDKFLDGIQKEKQVDTIIHYILLFFSTSFHSSNPEFSHYNIYRETNFFSSVSGLKPIASGKEIPELQNVQLEKWTDKFPPTGASLFYAVTVVNHKGEETKHVVPKQV